MELRERLLSTVRAIAPVLEVDGVLVAGSEVPNLLEPRAASTLVVSQDLDVAVPLSQHAEVKARRVRDVDELVGIVARLPSESRAHVRHNLVILSMASGVAGMPEPAPHRDRVAAVLARIEATR